MTVRDIIAILEAVAPSKLAYDWDRVGLHTGSFDKDVSRVLVTLSVTPEAVTKAHSSNADMIVSHHPLIWEPIRHLRPDSPHANLCLDLAQSGIACFGAHTNLDVAPAGVNDVLATRLALQNIQPLFPVPQAEQVKLVCFVPESHVDAVRDAVSDAGAGVIGNYTHCSFSSPGFGTFLPGEESDPFSGKKGEVNREPELRFETLVLKARLPRVLDALFAAHPYDEVAYDVVRLDNRHPNVSLGRRGELEEALSLSDFANLVKDALEINHVRIVGDAKHRMRTVAVLGGAGGDYVSQVPADVDVFVTGDVKYHHALDANERKLAVIDAGHHGTEKWIVPALVELLRSRVDGVDVEGFVEADPFVAVAKRS